MARLSCGTKTSQNKAVLENFIYLLFVCSPLVSVVPDLVGWHEEKHWSVEAPAGIFLSDPLLHQPHFLQVKSSFHYYTSLSDFFFFLFRF